MNGEISRVKEGPFALILKPARRTADLVITFIAVGCCAREPCGNVNSANTSSLTTQYRSQVWNLILNRSSRRKSMAVSLYEAGRERQKNV